ncbi:exo-alpha-sialidase [Lentzea sp. BCCO 10_0798]|uniref:Exo-alpha-sialidase n=1 Tax=Lentzea kristufekii TaxID=3095430 RepID=A0ABU4TJE9_9PSEU|nr:exo-alpha-sialidase [Lentzea sp. BCCO 10_0798]MDX8048397.1 exo-alpha-sialidase [Lentzea sp. BCCO 10_0798]
MRRLIITALVATLTVLTTPSPALAAQVLLTGVESRHPHAIRLEHGTHRGSILVALHGFHVVNVLRATRAGKKFRQIGTFTDEVSAHATCCGHLYELPRQVGEMPAGTVLWAGSVGLRHEGLKARIWRSDNAGETWQHLSECARAMPGGGLWEPDLSVDARGRLNCYFADETHEQHSQYIGRSVSADGVLWSGKEKVVALSAGWLRPGMPQVKRLPTGDFYMMYEICSQPDQYFCEAYHRSSPDGVNWGDPTWHGTRPTTKDGRYFAHTPSITLAPNGTSRGRVILMGQMLMSADGKVDPGNGRTVFVSENGGRDGWYAVPAPVAVPGARDDNCPNYHPSGVASLDGGELIGFASDFAANGGCHTSWATSSLPPFPG